MRSTLLVPAVLSVALPAVLTVLLRAALAGETADSLAAADYLRCEYRVDPLGIDVLRPRLSWEMRDARRGARQTAYQVLAASTPERLAAGEGDLWDSGRVQSDLTSQIEYAGKPLGSRTRCHWRVRLWDADGKASAFSKPALWTMGLLKPEDVKARWIGLDGPMVYPGKGPALTFEGCQWIWSADIGAEARKAAPKGPRFFRGKVTVPEGAEVVRARFLLTGDDSFELFVAGKPAARGQAFNDPQLADVTNWIKPGENLLAVVVTNGADGNPAGLAGKLVVELGDGRKIVQPIDATWKANSKPVQGWNTGPVDESKWLGTVALAKVGEAPWNELKVTGADVLACPMFRKQFQVEGQVRRATLYASALGVYRMSINGQPAGADYFTPDWTDYRKRVYYNTYDVTGLVRSDGPNAIGGVLGAGWYAGAIGWKSERFHDGDRPALFAQLELEMADGSRRTIVTDGTWKAAFGPIIEGEFLAGETYDARKGIAGWDEPGLDDSGWLPVAVTEKIAARLEAFPNVTVQETGELRPQKITEPKPGTFVFDLGRNFAGVARLRVKGPAGTKVVLRFAERLNPDGTIYTTNLRGARCTDTYVCKGDGDEVWQPRFTFHGFQYVEVTGYPGRPGEDAVTGVALNSATPMTGQFECSSPMVNKLYGNITWTQRANFLSIPTDCPQRDERLGWTGDAEVFIRAATYNADVASFFTKWLVDLHDAQRPDGAVPDVAPYVLGLGAGTAAWADAGTICPWTVYEVYGDKRILEKHYPMMAGLVEFYRNGSKDLLRPAAGYGDWLSVGAETPKDVLATAFFAHSADLTARAARVLGKEDDARKYGQLFEQVKAAFNRAYVGDDGRIKGDTQTCCVLALGFDLLPEDKRAAAAKRLVDDIRAHGTHLTTGFVGTSVLMPTLTQVGATDVAYKLLLNETYPSWGYSIKHGATSIWERWDGWTAEKGFQDPGMNSFAHYSFGAVARWMFQSVAGIDTDGPGFRRLVVRPRPEKGLDWVTASYRSIHGRIATEWRREGEGLALAVTVPANTTATVYVPAASAGRVIEGGRPAGESPGVKFLRREEGAAVFEVGAGEYRFIAR